MKKYIITLFILCLLLQGCSYIPEETKIYPVTAFGAGYSGSVALFDIGNQVVRREFEDEQVFYCEEGESRVIAIYNGGFSNDINNALRLYLYLSKEDYEIYLKDRYHLSE